MQETQAVNETVADVPLVVAATAIEPQAAGEPLPAGYDMRLPGGPERQVRVLRHNVGYHGYPAFKVIEGDREYLAHSVHVEGGSTMRHVIDTVAVPAGCGSGSGPSGSAHVVTTSPMLLATQAPAKS